MRVWTQRSMRETMRDARLRFPWRMIVFVMNWRSGSSAGGMSKAGGGAAGVAKGTGAAALVAGVVGALAGRADRGF